MPGDKSANLAAETEARGPELISLFSVSRSGSTLLAEMLQALPGVETLSEPDIYTQVVRLGVPDEQAVPLTRSMARLLVSSQCSPEHRHLAIKYRASVIGMARQIQEASGGPALFIYRNAYPVVRSAMEALPVARQSRAALRVARS